ncbi:MAG: hypothetical protein HC769_11215 [Cyanobacteria bacterium CRU_2_1]|nr:hypothetical protein [Cyanobacteria bacterium RU_5_0]NJR59361.1 hypothetical protein [Cyanobacteria bacterium CRU_2_1]
MYATAELPCRLTFYRQAGQAKSLPSSLTLGRIEWAGVHEHLQRLCRFVLRGAGVKPLRGGNAPPPHYPSNLA